MLIERNVKEFTCTKLLVDELFMRVLFKDCYIHSRTLKIAPQEESIGLK